VLVLLEVATAVMDARAVPVEVGLATTPAALVVDLAVVVGALVALADVVAAVVLPAAPTMNCMLPDCKRGGIRMWGGKSVLSPM
jgi:hypothetical protein